MLGFGMIGAGLSIIFPMALAAASCTPGVVPASAIARVSMCGYSGLPPFIGAGASVLELRGGLAIFALTSLVVAFLARSFRESGVAPTERRR